MNKKLIFRIGFILLSLTMISQKAEAIEGVAAIPIDGVSLYPVDQLVFTEVSMVGKTYLNVPVQLKIKGKDPNGNTISFGINNIDSNRISIANLVETCEKAAGMVMMNPKKYFFSISSHLYSQDPGNTIFSLDAEGSFGCYLHKY